MRLVRSVIRAVSLVLAVVLGLFVCQLIEVEQRRSPFDTAWSFDLDTSRSALSKDELLQGLSALADEHGATVLKVVADPDDFEGKRDVFWFGTQPPRGDHPPTDGETVRWFDPSLTGEFLPATELGDRPLAGQFHVSESAGFAAALEEWAPTSGAMVFPFEALSGGTLATVVVSLTGIGNATAAVAILLVASLVIWFVTQARSRSLRLLGGVSPARIHAQDGLELAANVGLSIVTGLVAITAYTGWTRGAEHLPMFLRELAAPAVGVLLAVTAVIVVLSLATRPTVSAIARRQIPLRAFGRVGTVVRFVAVALSIAVLPAALVYAQNSSVAAREQSVWEGLRDTVRVSFSSMSVFETGEGLADATGFLSQADEQGILALSFTVDASIGMTDGVLGDYDHLVITDDSFLQRMDVGIVQPGGQGQLEPTAFGDIDRPLQELIESQFALWTRSGDPLPEGMDLYTYAGPGLPAAGHNVGLGGETVFAENPLVVVVDDPVSTLDVHGFLLPAMSLGNVLFTDADALRTLLVQHEIAPYIASIDQVADLALDSAQAFAQETRLYLLAAGLILAALLVASIQGAQLWAGANERRIFTLHSSGVFYRSIVLSPVRTEIVLLAGACVTGAIVPFLVRRTETGVAVGAIAIVAVLYLASTFAAHRASAQRAFSHATHRQH